MKYKNFAVRFLSLTAISAMLFAYNSIAAERQLMVEENEKRIAEAEAYNESIMALENAAGGNTGTETVSVVYADGKIVHVEILSAKSEDSAYLDMAESLTEDIVKKQSVEIDTVSGATYSSGGILDAAADALSKAVMP